MGGSEGISGTGDKVSAPRYGDRSLLPALAFLSGKGRGWDVHKDVSTSVLDSVSDTKILTHPL